MDVDELVKKVFPRTTGEAILELLARRVGEIVTLEDMAVAAFGDTPDVWSYASSGEWHNTARSHIGTMRKRLLGAGLDLDIETVIGAGYRMHQRPPRRRMTPAETAEWRGKVLAEYARLTAKSPDLSLNAICELISKKYRRKLYTATLGEWLGRRTRQPEGGSP